MRGMRFRAWDTLNNKYFENTYEAYKGDLEILQIGLNGRLQLITSLERRDESLFPDRFIIQQYTGLKDVKGVDIYEGDILKVFVLDSKGPHAKVKLKNGVFGIEDDMFGYGFYKGHYSLHQILSRYDAEIIGNIYEHPELLGDNQ